MRILGIDYGMRRIGLAISDGNLAAPLGTVHDLPGVIRIISMQDIAKVIIGLPDPHSVHVKNFGRRLSEIAELPVEYWDETLSTVIARKKMNAVGASNKEKKAQIDQNAAAVILQSYLDSKRPDMPI
jgi:putative holliday junction resolvase